LAQQVRQSLDVVNNQNLQNYVQTLGQKLASTPSAGEFPYEFTLINDPSINAFALPGGPIFLHTGLIQNADNEGQVAGVVAHEIAHVRLRHGTNQASRANLLEIPAVLAGAVLGQGAGAEIGRLGIGLGLQGVLLRYSRTAERQADALGAKMMTEAGFNPIEMARFFEKLEQASGGSRAPEFLSSHPNPGNRVRLVQEEIQALPASEYTAGTGRFAEVQRAVAQLPAPRQPQQAAVQRQAAPGQPPSAPTGGFQRIDGRTFSVAYPSEWQAFGDRDAASVTVAPRQGLVQTNTGMAIGYGAVMGYFFPQGRTNLQNATRQVIQSLQASNPQMQVAGGARQVSVDGSQGLVTNMTSPSPYGGAETNVLLTVARPEGVFYMVFIAPQQQFQQLSGTFEQMVQSIQFRG
jgi:beta-barrel assembly-enhancing protease